MSLVLSSIATGSTDGLVDVGVLVSGEIITGTGPSQPVTCRLDASTVATIHTAGPADVRAAYEAAARALPAWTAMGPSERAAIFHRAAELFRQRVDEVAAVISTEMGKPLSEARTEVDKGAAVLDYYGEFGFRRLGTTFRTDFDEDVFTLTEPLGVVALITPWNFPFTIPLRKLSAALAAGNTVLFKPSMNSALTGLLIGSVLLEAGVPVDALHVVVGRSSVIEEALLTAPELAGVSLTGSHSTATAIRRRLRAEVPFQAELGGKNTLVIWKDADLDRSIDIIMNSSFRNNGQICTSAGRLLVHDDIFEELLTKLHGVLLALPDHTATDELGILVSDGEAKQVEDMVALGHSEARDVLRPQWRDDRVPPTLLVEPQRGTLTREEIFGPVLTVERVHDISETVALANDTAYGLTSGIVTSDLAVAREFWKGSKAGTVKVNSPLTGIPVHVPFEGWGESGAGYAEGGEASLDFFTRTKTVYVRSR